MAFTKLQFKPGIVSDITSYSNEGGFVDGDKIRFRLGFPEKIGGWVPVNIISALMNSQKEREQSKSHDEFLKLH